MEVGPLMPRGIRKALTPRATQMLMCVVCISLVGCTATEQSSEVDGPTTTSTIGSDDVTEDPVTSAPRELSESALPLASASYVEQLCDVDPFAAANAEDPIGALLAQFGNVSTTSPEEQAELAEIVAAFELSRIDPASEALVDAIGTLRARCNRVVLR